MIPVVALARCQATPGSDAWLLWDRMHETQEWALTVALGRLVGLSGGPGSRGTYKSRQQGGINGSLKCATCGCGAATAGVCT